MNTCPVLWSAYSVTALPSSASAVIEVIATLQSVKAAASADSAIIGIVRLIIALPGSSPDFPCYYDSLRSTRRGPGVHTKVPARLSRQRQITLATVTA